MEKTAAVCAKRRMQATLCFIDYCDPPCLHQTEHDEIRASDRPEPYYQNTCGYHGCLPVEQARGRAERSRTR
jgi:hypothetical protein